MEAIQTFATSTLPQSQRLRYWNELAERIYSGTYVNADESFHGRMQTWNLGDLHMIRPTGGHSHVGRRERGHGADNIILHLQSRGSCRHRQDAVECVLQPGDFVLSCANRGYEMELAEHELLVIEFPRAPVLERFTGLDGVLTRKIHASGLASGRVFIDYLHSIWRQGGASAQPMPCDPFWSNGVADVFYDLLAMALRESAGHEGGLVTSLSLQRQLLDHVEANLDDPDLRTGTIAAALSTSPRTVQNAFAAMGTTPSAYILDARLQRAADRMTADPAATITAIAFDLGFNDSAYFSRCFRRKFAMSPRQWRNSA
ncbi:helix-turn-helix domain-containing protein [Novosphingobium profundi]|uniref:helix-turn-helix domain-containing protein n=1 Tax=Novosphingobium profundi TaxID=1774954 RepID=UPI001BD92BAF|nr:helix-turn-helix domain-containing protein [Novosphingobium profundi]MBT0670943.1 helix-turn-helix domain-containing protein [Novosphingobium profundi]